VWMCVCVFVCVSVGTVKKNRIICRYSLYILDGLYILYGLDHSIISLICLGVSKFTAYALDFAQYMT